MSKVNSYLEFQEISRKKAIKASRDEILASLKDELKHLNCINYDIEAIIDFMGSPRAKSIITKILNKYY